MKLGDIKHPIVKRIDPLPARPPPGQVRDITVDVFIALVVAHVNHHPAVVCLLHPGALVLEAPERGALNRRRFRIERVDLHHPAKPVRLVGFEIGVESGMGGVPAQARTGGRDAVSQFQRRSVGKSLLEESVEIFLAAEKSSPGGKPHGAVVQRTEYDAAGRIRARF